MSVVCRLHPEGARVRSAELLGDLVLGVRSGIHSSVAHARPSGAALGEKIASGVAWVCASNMLIWAA